ncbi:RDD family protein [Streptomyces achromogenes]|uniref:RDD family protein n=1 Tax=Streptomyces achromogenes TaxID=67255 RepID=UPI0036A0AD33
MSAPTPAPGDDRPREGYYPDPSIPGYVRYWNGASWVPGTSRPAPKDGEPLIPPPGIRPAAPVVEETGPHFFDEDPPAAADTRPAGAPGAHGSAGGPADQWAQAGQGGAAGAAGQRGAGNQADPAAQAGQASQWSQSAPPAQSGQSGRPGGAGVPGVPGQSGGPGMPGVPGQPGGPGPAGEPGSPGTPAHPGVPGQSGGSALPGGSALSGAPAQPGTPGLPGQRDRSGGFGGDAGRGGAWGADPRVPMDSPAGPGGQGATRADGAAAVPPAEAGDAPDPGTFVFRRPVPGPAAARTDDGTMTIRPVPSDPPGPAADAAPAGFGSQGPAGAPAASGFGAGKAAAQAAAAAQTPLAPQSPQPQAPHPAVAPPVPQQSGPAPVTTPVTSGPGGGQASWAQQVHQLAGGGDEPPVAPWKPPVEDFFQAAARRQAAARPAGLGKRLAARLIDLAVVGAVTAAAAVPLGIRAADHVQQKIDAARLSGHQVTVWLLDGTTGTALGIVLAVLLAAGVLYEVLPTVRWGRTLGKKLCGLEVRDIEAHEPPAFGPALRRWLVFSVPGLLAVGVVGVLWCLFDRPWRQCWHDKAAHTFVAG